VIYFAATATLKIDSVEDVEAAADVVVWAAIARPESSRSARLGRRIAAASATS
jgi:hypothetical protein